MPDAVIYEDQRLPASYANFYISNAAVVPIFNCAKDDRALQIQQCFPERKVVGRFYRYYLGIRKLPCLSQQEPLAWVISKGTATLQFFEPQGIKRIKYPR